MPAEVQLQAKGFAVYRWRYFERLTVVGEVSKFLADRGPAKFWLEEYFATFRTTIIAVCAQGEWQPDYHLRCTGTMRIETPVDSGWSGRLTVVTTTGGLINLVDSENDVSILAGSVTLSEIRRC